MRDAINAGRAVDEAAELQARLAAMISPLAPQPVVTEEPVRLAGTDGGEVVDIDLSQADLSGAGGHWRRAGR